MMPEQAGQFVRAGQRRSSSTLRWEPHYVNIAPAFRIAYGVDFGAVK